MEIIKTDLAIKLEEKYNIDFTPTKGTPQSAAYDVRACIEEELVLYPLECVKVSLGFSAHIGSYNNNLAGYLLPRSGIGSNDGIVLGNLIGLIDADYQNEWQAAILNRNDGFRVRIKPGMKIAQLVFLPVINNITFKDMESFSNSTSRKGGFGHTGNM